MASPSAFQERSWALPRADLDLNPAFPRCGAPGKSLHPPSLGFPRCHVEILILTLQRCCEDEEVNTWETASQMVLIQ